MRFAFLLGGVAGFCVGAGTTILTGVSSDRVFLDGAIGCLVGGFLARWFWGVLIACFRDLLLVRQQELAAAAAKRSAEQSSSKV